MVLRISGLIRIQDNWRIGGSRVSGTALPDIVYNMSGNETLDYSSLFAQGSRNIFVFESDRLGRNDSTTARFARKYCGAVQGQSHGLVGNSYALTCMAEDGSMLALTDILQNIRILLHFAKQQEKLTFYIPRIGCGLLRYGDMHIAPMFAGLDGQFRLPRMWQVQDCTPSLTLDASSILE